MSNPLGVAINFAYLSTTNGITITGISGFLLQSTNSDRQADEEQIRSADGIVAARQFYNPNDKAVIEAVITGTGQANAITNTTKPTAGSLIVVTACANDPDLVRTWVCDSSSIQGSNTTAKKLVLNVSAHATITAAANA